MAECIHGWEPSECARCKHRFNSDPEDWRKVDAEQRKRERLEHVLAHGGVYCDLDALRFLRR